MIACAHTIARCCRRSRLAGGIYLAVVGVVLHACVHAAEQPSSDLEFFEKKVRPLLQTHCYECHAGDRQRGGLALDSRAGWAIGGSRGPAIEPGSVAQSLVIQAVRYDDPDLEMPPSGRLSSAEVTILESWVARGAVDPRADADGARGRTAMTIEEGRRFWSMKPLHRPSIPDVQDDTWAASPIDNFVLARLEQQQMRPAPPPIAGR